MTLHAKRKVYGRMAPMAKAAPQPARHRVGDDNLGMKRLDKLLLLVRNLIELRIANKLIIDSRQGPVLEPPQAHDNQARVMAAVPAVDIQRVIPRIDHVRQQRGHQAGGVHEAVVVLGEVVPDVAHRLGEAVLADVAGGGGGGDEGDEGAEVEAAEVAVVLQRGVGAAVHAVLDDAEAEGRDEGGEGGGAHWNIGVV